MNSVERVKLICKQRKIPISKLEKDLGFSNGYIGQLRKGIFPADRLERIAQYFSVSSDYLLSGDESGRKVSDYELKIALFGEDQGKETDEMLEDVKKYAKFLKLRDQISL